MGQFWGWTGSDGGRSRRTKGREEKGKEKLAKVELTFPPSSRAMLKSSWFDQSQLSVLESREIHAPPFGGFLLQT